MRCTEVGSNICTSVIGYLKKKKAISSQMDLISYLCVYRYIPELLLKSHLTM